MSKTPYISAIIPTYNRGKYIATAIRSILEQKNNKWNVEIIVVDDGSTDNTEEVLKEFEGKITYIKTPNSGKPATPRNIGIKKAKGELIAFLDSDDMWVSDKLALQIPLFDEPELVLSCGNATIMDEKGKKAKKPMGSVEQLKGAEKFSTLVKQNAVSTLTTVIRKEAFYAVGGFNESEKLRAVEDYDLWLRISAAYPKGIKIVPETLAYYRQHDDNISASDPFQAIERLINVYDSLWDFPMLGGGNRKLLEEKLDAMHENWSRVKVETGSKPAISVVMSVYNGEGYLAPAIKSILDQTFTEFEFIIIDDGSIDSSVDIIRSFNDPRIRLIRQTNHKLVYSLNKGVRLARADFIARQDADDISLPNRFEKELAWLTVNDDRGLVGSFFTYIHERTSSPTSTTITSPTKHIDLHRMMGIVNPFAHGSTMYRKKFFNGAGGYREDYGPTEDYDLWRRMVQLCQVGQIPEVLYWYRLSPTSISHTNQDSQHSYAAQIVNEVWREHIPFKLPLATLRDAGYYGRLDSLFAPIIKQQYKDQQIRLAFEHLIRGRLLRGYITAFSATLLNPWAIRALAKILLWAIPKKLLGKAVK